MRANIDRLSWVDWFIRNSFFCMLTFVRRLIMSLSFALMMWTGGGLAGFFCWVGVGGGVVPMSPPPS